MPNSDKYQMHGRTVKKLLNEDETRELAIGYLCGINYLNLSDFFHVTPSSVRVFIGSKDYQKFDDELVSFYSSTEPKERFRNAAHLYLSHEDYEFKKASVVKSKIPDNAFRLVQKVIFTPALTSVYRGLEELLVPRNGYDRLLKVVLYDRIIDSDLSYEQALIKPIFDRTLSEEYSANDKLLLRNVVAQSREEFVTRVVNAGLALSKEKTKLIDDVLSNLTLNQTDVLILRGYGKGTKMHTFDEVAGQKGLTKERIRQIEAKAIRKLAHPLRVSKLMTAFGFYNVQDIETQNFAYSNKEVVERMRKEIYDEMRPRLLAEFGIDLQSKEFLFRKSVNELELSTRAANVLFNARVSNMGELASLSENKIRSFRNCGRGTVKEIKDALAKLGLSLGMTF